MSMKIEIQRRERSSMSSSDDDVFRFPRVFCEVEGREAVCESSARYGTSRYGACYFPLLFAIFDLFSHRYFTRILCLFGGRL